MKKKLYDVFIGLCYGITKGCSRTGGSHTRVQLMFLILSKNEESPISARGVELTQIYWRTTSAGVFQFRVWRITSGGQFSDWTNAF